MKLDSVKQTFVVESAELLEEMERSLLDLEKDPEDESGIHAIFRAAHTIKGSSGMFQYTGIVEFTHVLESFLEELRQGKFKVNSDMIAALLESGDHIKELISIYNQSDHAKIDDETKKRGDELHKRLSDSVGTFSVEQPGSVKDDLIEEESTIQETGVKVQNPCWHISLRFNAGVLKHGLDPLSFVNYLSGMGEIQSLCTLSDSLPPLAEMEPENCYIGLELDLKSESSYEEIDGVFDFIKEDALIYIIAPGADMGHYLQFIEDAPEPDEKLKAVLLEMGSLSEDELSSSGTDEEVFIPIENTQEAQKTQEASPMQVDVNPSPVMNAAREEKTEAGKNIMETASKFIRIDAQKLDNLINLVGELVINVANIRQLSERNGDKEIIESSLVMGRLVEEVRDSAMNIRMVQIGDTFKRFERVVRDLSRNMGKEIELKISGGETELDKTVVEKISDPLMHLIRNSVDHGIARPDVRVSKGKPSKGTIHVNAFHDTGNIVIEISDDGEGINREAVLSKALEKGLAVAGNDYTDEEVFRFIFEPGFSTAAAVTDVSGRGVGMDVVKRNIEALRGIVEIESEENIGTTMRVNLPLTLAIIDGFLVEIGSGSYVIPLDMVLECITISEEQEVNQEGGNFVNLRGEVLPYLKMRDFFQEHEEENDQENIIVVKYGQYKAGLVVDKLLGEFQTVIKPLGRLFNNLQGISGATILGNGEVALILDIPKLIRYAQSLENIERKNKAKLEK